MAKKIRPLTNTEVKQAKAQEKEYTLADGDGLQLRIKPSGSKNWVLKYSKPFTKVRTNIGLGTYPEISLKQARDKRAEARTLLAQDIDPKTHRDENAALEKELYQNTLNCVVINWFEIKKTEIKSDYAKDIWRSLELHVLPKLGSYPISKLTAPIAIDALKKVSASGNLETVRRLAQRLNEVMTFAVNTGFDPCQSFNCIKSAFEKPKVQHMATIKPDELPEFMSVLNSANLKVITRALMEFQLHTITRSNEAAKACWEELDLDKGLWVIPADRMKMNREHIIPLSPYVISIIKIMEQFKQPYSEYVFPSHINPRKHINTETVNKALRRIGYQNRLVAHGFRALASTTLNEQGFDSDVIESALAHVDKNAVRKAYNRAEYLEHRTKLMNWWSEHIEKT